MTTIDFLNKYKDILSLSAIESKCKIPKGTLKQVLYDNRQLPNKHALELYNYICTIIGTRIDKPIIKTTQESKFVSASKYKQGSRYDTFIVDGIETKATWRGEWMIPI